MSIDSKAFAQETEKEHQTAGIHDLAVVAFFGDENDEGGKVLM
jgi:hypothetical protein